MNTVDAKIEKAARNKETFLNLARSGLNAIPAKVCGLVQLERLYLAGNSLSSLPACLAGLPHLFELDLNGNHFTWPWDVCALGGLSQLGLENNRIEEISPTIANLTSLENLGLSGNRISRLPPELFSLTLLSRLDLADNQLKSLPLGLDRLRSLSEIWLSGNPLRVPEQVWAHPNLKSVYLDDKQYAAVPQAVRTRGRPEIHVP